MASHLSVSLSESLQASLTIQHQEEQRKQQPRQRPSHRPRSTKGLVNTAPSKDQDETPSKGLSILMQGLLAISLSGVEFSSTFTLIYTILFLQFIGVPTSLLTVHGVIAGTCSMVTLPISGYLSDRGDNLVIRKMTMMMFVLLTYILGYVGLATCASMRLEFKHNQNAINNSTNITHNNNTSILSHSVSILHQFVTTGNGSETSSSSQFQTSFEKNHFTSFSFTTPKNYTPTTIINETNIISTLNHDESSVNSFGIIQALGIISSALLDIGFDSANSLCRAYMLECSPPSTHNQLLITATISNSLGGLVCALIGTVDLPSKLESRYGVDGTAATILFFGTGTLVYVVFSFGCTMTAGYYVYRRGKKILQEDHNIHGRLRKSSSHLISNSSLIHKSSDISDESDESAPLLNSGREVDGRDYSAISSSAVEHTDPQQLRAMNYNHAGFDKQQYQKILSPWEHNAGNVIHEDKPFETSKSSIDEENDDQNNQNFIEEENVVSEIEANDESDVDDDDDYGVGNNEDHHQEEESEISNVFAAMRASYSQSLSVVHKSLMGGATTDMQAQKSTHSHKPANTSDPSSQGQSIWSSKRLKLLVFSIFFVLGGNLCVNMYSNVTLNEGVYHGDPTAPPGTKERELYNKGLRVGSLGLLVMYCTYSLVCIMNRRIMAALNEKRYFMLCQVVLTTVLVTFTFTKTIETYFASMVALGFSRACAFTLAYIMINKFIREELSGNNDSSKPTQKIGQITALIGFILPSTYVFLSILMGPLMAALDSVWVPIVIAAIDSALSLIIFGIFTVING